VDAFEKAVLVDGVIELVFDIEDFIDYVRIRKEPLYALAILSSVCEPANVLAHNPTYPVKFVLLVYCG
jgi:hypothetical protein